MTFCISEFSVWFCFVHSTKESSLELDSTSLCLLPFNINQLKSIIHVLSEMYKDEFEPFWGNLRAPKKENSYEYLMKLILSKCVHLSSTPSHLSFLLVCAFIYFLISERFDQDAECFSLVHIASHCLIAVFNKCYKDFFDIGLFQSFYIELNYKLVQKSSVQGRKKLSPFNQEDIIKLMTIFKNIDEVEYNFDAIEQALFMQTRVPVPPADNPVLESAILSESDEKPITEATQTHLETDETYSKEETIQNDSETDSKEETFQYDSETDETSLKTSSSFESEETSSREENMYEWKGSLKTDKEFFNHTNQFCPVCKTKCFEFAFSLVTDMFIKKERSL